MATPDIIAFISAAVILVLFLGKAIHARRSKADALRDHPWEEQMLASREIGFWGIAFSTAATYSAFATVLFWFVTLGAGFSWLLFLIPICLYLGNYLFVHAAKQMAIPLGSQPSIPGYVRENSEYKPLYHAIDWVVVIFVFSAVLVELVIGSSILASMVPSVDYGQLIFFVLISFIVFTYVIIGGLRAVLATDTYQFFLALAGAVILLVYAFLFLDSSSSDSPLFYPPRITTTTFIAFISSVVAVQFLGPLCKLHNWHRLAAATDANTGLKGHHIGALVAAGLWVIMIFAALALNTRMNGAVTFDGIFDKMKSQGNVTAYVFYPIIFAGLIAAMVSTADSALAALFLFVYENIRRSETNYAPTLWSNVRLGVLLFLVMAGVYWLNRSDLQGFAVTVIYFLFNQLLVAFPVLFYLAFERKGRDTSKIQFSEGKQRSQHRWLAVAIAAGWIVVLAMSAVGYWTGVLSWTMFASISGVGVSLVICVWPSIELKRNWGGD